MSQGDPVEWAIALDVARRLVTALDPVCERVKIAGSLRRRKPMVSDIEIVAMPRFDSRVLEPGLLINEASPVDLLEERIAQLLGDGEIEPRQVVNHRGDGSIDVQTKLGPAFKALVAGGIPVDLFIVRPPAAWGVIFALRTGPGDWNTRLVTECKAIGRRVSGGQVEAWNGAVSSWVPLETPEETDFFRQLGQPWLEPQERHVDRVAIRREAIA